jgi:predicted nucleic acid-binding protein
LIDTSVYIENFKFRRFEAELLSLRFLVRCSAVVLAELWRGARSWEAKRFVASLAKQCQVIAPNEREWIQSGKIVSTLAERRGYEVNKMREIHFDVLIALTAKRIGAFVITCNADDFKAIREVKRFNLICW